jgi:ribonuclease P protein component
MIESGSLASKGNFCASRSSPRMMAMSQGGVDRDLFLKRSRDIEYAKKHGRRISTAFFNMMICPTDVTATRVGIVVGKRFGGAVSRNRVKRLFRELTRQAQGQLIEGQARVVFPKRESILQPFAVLKAAWFGSLQRQRLLRTQED